MRRLHEILAFPGEQGVDGGWWTMTSCVDGGILRLIVSNGGAWDHVSVSRADRTPVWDEMEQVKHACFRDDETALQLHVPLADHVNHHPNCLHLWRPQQGRIPRPPVAFV